MTQTIALLVDAYRELNARKMFWVSLVISGLVIVLFALLGIGANGLTFLGMDLPLKPAPFFYKYAFSGLVIEWWVGKGAMVLALISTASIFPELIAGGSIDLYLSKPIGRLRLFLTKYLGGLLFVLLQTAVFAVGSYLVFGLRGGQWRPALFLIIPLTALLFSYLFAVCVLVGVVTRSTLAAILMTTVFWVACSVGNFAERTLQTFRTMQAAQAQSYEREARKAEADLADMKRNPSVLNAFGIRERRTGERRQTALRQADEARGVADRLATWHAAAYAVTSFIPKTGETIDLLDRAMFDDADLAAVRERAANQPQFGRPPPAAAPATGPTGADEARANAEEDRKQAEMDRRASIEAQAEAERVARSRSVSWIVGTSVAFEAVVLGLAAWVFCRRDY